MVRNIKWKAALLAVMLLVAMLAAPVTAAPGMAVERADYLVGFHGPPSRALVEQFGGQVYAEFTIVDAIAVRLPTPAVTALEKNPMVAYVEPDAEVYALEQTVPWGIDRVFNGETSRGTTWGTTKGKGIGVAVLDTGIGPHEDLIVQGGVRYYTQGLIFPRLYKDNKYQDGHGHGTHVAGTVAALDNNFGVVGVAPAADLYAVKVLTDSGSGSTTATIAGIQWVVDNASAKNIKIINMSLGSPSYSETFKNACDNAYNAGILVVSSAGNSGNSTGTGDNVGYPAKYASVVAVAASDSSDQRAYFSSTGPAVELIAPGASVLSTVLNNGYATYNGTSMASPHVAGVAALVWGAKPSLKNTEVRGIFSATAENLGLPKEHQGNGLVRADLAVAKAEGIEPPPPPQEYSLTISSTTGGSVTTPGEGNFTYSDGTVVNLVAVADSGYQFVNWTGDTGSIANVNAASTTITMNGSYSITANFEAIIPPNDDPYSVSVTTDKATYGFNAWVNITVTVQEGTANAAGVSVSMGIEAPDGSDVSSQTGTTDTSGVAAFRYRIGNARTAQKGVYTVSASASKNNEPYSGSITFTVQ
ncbi:MAG: S8 family serine peptidase [Bacillota bacterium]|nr:S8 family serine peptidase [Bacillota bacterium]MDW7677657.1 S8 family serine peptidase [Bacillota bacterium]